MSVETLLECVDAASADQRLYQEQCDKRGDYVMSAMHEQKANKLEAYASQIEDWNNDFVVKVEHLS